MDAAFSNKPALNSLHSLITFNANSMSLGDKLLYFVIVIIEHCTSSGLKWKISKRHDRYMKC